MEFTELKQLIRKGECQTLDFKQSTPHVYKIAKTIVSFANTDGGQLLVGVKDNKTIVGVDPEEEKYLLDQAATFYCDPPIHLTYDKVETEDEKIVLVVTVPNSSQKPHYCMNNKEEWNAYTRMNDKSVLASKMTVLLSNIEEEENNRKLTKQEESLLKYLHLNERISLKGYAKLVNFSERRAKKNLIELTKEGILRLYDFEKEVFYTLA